MRPVRLAALFVAASALIGCGPKMIPNSEILDTDENHEILSVISAYKNALEARNAEKILELSSQAFFENSGTPEGEDDYNHEGLQERLKKWQQATKAVRADLRVKTLIVTDDTARAQYFFELNYQIVGSNGTTKWEHESDTKEMVLRREDSSWRIVSGI